MIDLVFRAAIAVVAAFAANKLVKITTGRSIPEHLAHFWNRINHDVAEWAKNHDGEKLSAIVVSIVVALDRLITSGLKIVNIKVHANKTGGTVISEYELSPEEARKLFPELATQTSLTLNVD